MEDLAKVRLVRCPKCENLLPELADYSVYQCGGCGAVLRAIDKTRSSGTGSNSFSDKPEEERGEGSSSNSECPLESRVVDSGCHLDTDAKSNSGSDQKESLKEDGDERCQNQSQIALDEVVSKNTLDVNANSKKSGKLVGRENEEDDSGIGSAKGSKISDRMSCKQNRERDEIDGCQRNLRIDMEDVRFSSLKSTNDGPSTWYPGSSYSYGDQWRRHKDHDGAAKVQYLEQDRAELLRKLDELKDQLTQSCHLVDNPKEFPSDERLIPPDSYGRSDTLFSDISASLKRVSMQFSESDNHVAGPSYINRHHDPFSYANHHVTSVHHDLARVSSQHSSYISGVQDPFVPQMLRRAPHGLPYQFQQKPLHPYFSGQYLDNSDPFDPFTYGEPLHHPSCSCFYCSDVKQQGLVQPPPASSGNRRFPGVANYPSLHRHEIPGKFGSHVHNSRTTNPLPNFQETRSHKRWPSELRPQTVSFMQNPRKVMLATSCRRCCPVAGGSPFLTCYSCFELLQIPHKPLNMVKSRTKKVRCGACSTVMTINVINGKLVLSPQSESNAMLSEVVNGSVEAAKNQGIYSHRHNMNGVRANFSSNDYDNLDFDFQSQDKEPTSLAIVLDSKKPQEMQNFHSFSPSTSDNENSPEVMITSRDVISTVPPTQAVSSPPPGSPLQEYFDHSSNPHAINRIEKGNQSSRSEQEKVKMNKATLRQNSMKEAAVATEVEVSFNDFSNNGVSQDSGDSVREDDQPRHNKGGESFFANIIKKSFKDFTKFNLSDERGKGTISVNGQVIPDRVVKKAEKLAGPIQPGKYWYDVHAGFWGVMGGPCLGIIPPFIEELSYPMPENCADGNTGVFINGRELNQNDLDLLAARGLPIEANRSYIIEISGRVFDEDTGEELDSLGKLAPTVEKVKHGFGMKPPRVAAAQ